MFKMWWMSRGGMLGFLILLSYIDIRTRRLPVILFISSGAGGLLYQLFWGRENWLILAAGVGMGIIFMVISKITKEGIGYGDSAAILVLGIVSGGRELIGILSITFFLLINFSIIIFYRKKVTRKYEVPFVPFLTGGYVLFLIVQGNL